MLKFYLFFLRIFLLYSGIKLYIKGKTIMYIQSTDKCNMSCKHCCFACTSRGTFMNNDIFYKSLCVAEFIGNPVTIGGR